LGDVTATTMRASQTQRFRGDLPIAKPSQSIYFQIASYEAPTDRRGCPVAITVRPMTLQETALIIEYFHAATPEYLEMLGVDPTRLQPALQWQRLYEQMFERPVEQRNGFLVSWLSDDRFLGFSTADKIRIGRQANMHLHITDPSLRKQGIGVECVRKTVELYFRVLELKQLFCEPNAFNVAPNRTLQKAGFTYVTKQFISIFML
jgi:RimJ/RimL family protein N-acetyltransferase